MQMAAEAATGREALAQFKLKRPDVTLMDLQMPDMGGIEAIIAIRGEFPDARIVVLTTYTGDVQVLRALKAGARAYLLKGRVNRELLEIIRAVHRGQKRIPPEIAAELADHATEDDLSPREIDVLRLSRDRKRQSRDRRQAFHYRGNREEPRHAHPGQTRSQ